METKIHSDVFSPTGSLLMNQKVDPKNSLDVSNLKTGTYIIIANKEGNKW